MERKTIVVPKDREAQIALNYDTATPVQLMELSLSQTEFKDLLKTGFFDLINKIAGVNIDDYEDERIEDKEKLEKVLESGIFMTNSTGKVAQIRALFEEAVSRGTGIYFYF